ncbi:HIRAN domain-containing protein [Blautia marasmi]|uniref:HIRAN domain-containing protein n=1 Tax=Blautia marasmi TaxID=1917868 RepID=UPI0039A3D457
MKKVSLEAENHRLAGVYYQTGNIELILENRNRVLRKGKKITTDTVELMPEPNNIYDHNAIKVVVDGYHIGYIKSGNCSHVSQLIEDNRIHHLSATIYRGDDDDSGDPFYTVTLTIYLNAA